MGRPRARPVIPRTVIGPRPLQHRKVPASCGAPARVFIPRTAIGPRPLQNAHTRCKPRLPLGRAAVGRDACIPECFARERNRQELLFGHVTCEDVRSTILVEDGEQTTHFILLSYSLSEFFRSRPVGLQSTPGPFSEVEKKSKADFFLVGEECCLEKKSPLVLSHKMVTHCASTKNLHPPKSTRGGGHFWFWRQKEICFFHEKIYSAFFLAT